jgi:hypothetical protein
MYQLLSEGIAVIHTSGIKGLEVCKGKMKVNCVFWVSDGLEDERMMSIIQYNWLKERCL